MQISCTQFSQPHHDQILPSHADGKGEIDKEYSDGRVLTNYSLQKDVIDRKNTAGTVLELCYAS